MSRVQLALNVPDIDEAVGFYSKLFATEPAKRKPGYANFAIADPPLKLVLFEKAGADARLNHLGVEVDVERRGLGPPAPPHRRGRRLDRGERAPVASPSRTRSGSTDPTARGRSTPCSRTATTFGQSLDQGRRPDRRRRCAARRSPRPRPAAADRDPRSPRRATRRARAAPPSWPPSSSGRASPHSGCRPATWGCSSSRTRQPPPAGWSRSILAFGSDLGRSPQPRRVAWWTQRSVASSGVISRAYLTAQVGGAHRWASSSPTSCSTSTPSRGPPPNDPVADVAR